ncbi:hypothetical protein IRT38_04575 [Acinetobacter sp. SK-43]|uniref:hypothetical protein n=1 Tax=Acinetobacter sp. SK-43 TaxID=2785295 RepID=UPI00188D9309|nr:hypothetical protein [Acinetobacter sp. SK-43]MBF4454672.1 hypothetical protein [Acinetobacter sp. SK-43]
MIFFKRNFFIFVIVVFSIFYLFSAWVADDAYITFRTVENFHQGYGLRWNIIERVQTYTHPLWMFHLLLGKYIVDDLYSLALVLGYIYSLATLYLLFLITRKNIQIFLLILLLFLSSRAVIDFSSSGLENSLSHFLVIFFFYILYFKQKSKYFFLILSLILSAMFLNRMDLIIPFIALAVYIFFIQSYKDKRLKFSLAQGMIGFIPVILWSLFALYYYGSFFANSVIAKTNIGLPRVQLQIQGFSYLYYNFLHDPLTSIIIYSTLIYTIFSKDKVNKILGLGLFLYLVYLINVGADYMYGRFLTIPFMISLCVLSKAIKLTIKQYDIITIFLLLFLIFNFYYYMLKQQISTTNYNFADERQFYYRTTGLIPKISGKALPIEYHFVETKALFESTSDEPIIMGTMGFHGYLMAKYHPSKHIIDELGLTDPFLAAHPLRYGYWRIGHFVRLIPQEYFKSVLLQQNLITEPNDRTVLNQIWLISRAPLNTPQRFQAIKDYNTGQIFKTAKQAFEHYPYVIDMNANQWENLWLKPNSVKKPIMYRK